jgi:putative mRNA 3-end processing factor
VASSELIEVTDRGLYCAAGDFYVDPWQPVDRAVITHAHPDHACSGCGNYLSTQVGEGVLRLRLGPAVSIQTAAYGEVVTLGRTRISLHPAGHILGSAQVRIESAGAVWVISGDYKTEPDPTCDPFEPIRCHAFVTESTFGLPIYRWPAESSVLADVRAWWQANQEAGKASLVFAYALGKAQRLLAGLDPETGPIFTHGAVEKVNAAYAAAGVRLPQVRHVATVERDAVWDRALIVAPPSARGTPWTRRFGALSTAFVSGWMQIRGTRRRRAIDRGFVLSDHADWPGLLAAVQATGAEQVWVTHGYAPVLARWLAEKGLDAQAVPTRFEGERDDAPDEVPAAEGET